MFSHADECLLRNAMHLTLPDETAEIAELEAKSFPADEKASLDGVIMRQQQAGEYFWTLGPLEPSQDDTRVLGFVNGTCTSHDEVTEESMETHEPEGSTLIIHSVVIHPKYRRQGLASSMLSYYLERMCGNEKITKILLISKGYLLGFYASVGFQVVRLSPVVHGKDPWFEMAIDLARMRLPTQYHVDAFTTEAFKGNQAGVVFQHYTDEEMQHLASENKFAETAFLQRITSDSAWTAPDPEFYIRWFTPTDEVALCGHATVAAAHALFEQGLFNSKLVRTQNGPGVVGTVIFRTKYRGILTARIIRDVDDSVLYELCFPSSYPAATPLESECRAHLCSGLGIKPADILYEGKAIDDIVIELSQESFNSIPSISSGSIDMSHISAIETTRGVIITCRAQSHKADFLSRFFCPKLGIDEDPVTGSAHCQLALYWCKKLSRNKLIGYQDSERGGYVTVEIPAEQRESGDNLVLLRGNALTIMTSSILCKVI